MMVSNRWELRCCIGRGALKKKNILNVIVHFSCSTTAVCGFKIQDVSMCLFLFKSTVFIRKHPSNLQSIHINSYPNLCYLMSNLYWLNAFFSTSSCLLVQFSIFPGFFSQLRQSERTTLRAFPPRRCHVARANHQAMGWFHMMLGEKKDDYTWIFSME